VKKINYIHLTARVFLLLMLISDCFAQTAVQKVLLQRCILPDKALKNRLISHKIHTYRLHNGLRVYLLENHRLPIFALRLVVKVGAADELNRQQGYAHLFEHMMFKGSKNIADGEHFSLIKQIGGNLNASTDYDKTEYWTEASVDYLDNVLWLEAERFSNLTFSNANLDNQRQAVLEEKLLRIDNVPYFKVASDFMISAWQGTAYDHLIIGSEQSLQHAAVSDVRSFFKQYYRPDNTVLVLVGDIVPGSTIKKIKKYFENNWIADKPKDNIVCKSSLTGSRGSRSLSGRSETRHDPLAPFPLYILGWHTAGKQNPDYFAVDILADILFKGESSRLKRRLKEQDELVIELLGMPLTFEQAGISASAFVPHSYTSFEQIKSVVRDELQRVQKQGVSSSELCSAIKNRQLKILKSMSDNRKMAQLIGDGALFNNDPYYVLHAFSAYQQVDNRQIKKVAGQYFHEDWLALEITPGPGVRLIKWLMEVLPVSVSKNLERQFL